MSNLLEKRDRDNDNETARQRESDRERRREKGRGEREREREKPEREARPPGVDRGLGAYAIDRERALGISQGCVW